LQVVYENADNEDTNLWARADLLRKWACIGTVANHGPKCSHILEAFYGFGEETKEIGIKGTPMWLRFNMRYILSDRSSCSGNYLIANHFEKNMRYSHQLDDHWNVSMHYH
jgi:hypothetical protein